MDLGVQLGPGSILLIILEQQLSGLFVEGRLGVGHNQKTLDRDQDVLDAELRLPVLCHKQL